MGLVKGVGFNSWRRVDTVLPAVRVYNMREVDELIIVDILATNENRKLDLESVEEFANDCFVPLTVGGGLSNLQDVRDLLLHGADKVSINSALYHDIKFASNVADRFGSQCVVASIDVRKENDGQYKCYSNSGKVSTGKNPVDWAIQLEAAGAGEILLTSIELDGTMQGYDIHLIHMVSEAVNIPVIASGGAGSYDHMYKALTEGKASAVAAASIFHFTEQTPLGAKKYLAEMGIPVRDSQIKNKI